MGTTSEKLARLDETKILLKQRLTEKGVDVASENNFYNLANKVGEIIQKPSSVSCTLSIIGSGVGGKPAQKNVVFYNENFEKQTYTIESGNGECTIPKNTIIYVYTNNDGSFTTSGNLSSLFTDYFNTGNFVGDLYGDAVLTFNSNSPM